MSLYYLHLNDDLIMHTGHALTCDSLDAAVGFAERVACVIGQNRSDEEIEGFYIRIIDDMQLELFRIAVSNDPSSEIRQ
jgi:hypothetical protein